MQVKPAGASYYWVPDILSEQLVSPPGLTLWGSGVGDESLTPGMSFSQYKTSGVAEAALTPGMASVWICLWGRGWSLQSVVIVAFLFPLFWQDDNSLCQRENNCIHHIGPRVAADGIWRRDVGLISRGDISCSYLPSSIFLPRSSA